MNLMDNRMNQLKTTPAAWQSRCSVAPPVTPWTTVAAHSGDTARFGLAHAQQRRQRTALSAGCQHSRVRPSMSSCRHRRRSGS
jgi:hypothetical protein